MSFRRIFEYTCNICCIKETDENYGGPPGFKYFYSNLDGIYHACSNCVETICAANLGNINKKDDKHLVILDKNIIPETLALFN